MNEKITNILKNPFFHGSIYITVSSFLIGFLNYLFNIFSARLLGPEGYGDITTLFALIAVLATPIAAFSTVLIQKIGARGDMSTEYSLAVEQWFFRLMKKWWPLLVLSLAFIPFSPHLTNISPVVAYALIPFLLYTFVATLYEGILQGLHFFFWFSVIGILITLMKLAGVGVAGFTSYQLLAMIVFLHGAFILRIALSKWVLNKHIPENRKKFTKIEKNLWHIIRDKQVIITVISLFAVVLVNNIDIVYAKKMFSASEAGIYSAWSLFAKIMLYLFGPLLQMSYIFFSDKKNLPHHQKILLGGVGLFMIAGIVATVGYTLFEPLLINLIFGKKFVGLESTLMWAALFGIGYAMVSYMNAYFLAKGSKKTLIFPLSVPFYVLALLIYPKDIGQLMVLNAIFILIVFFVYLIAYLIPQRAQTAQSR